MKPTEKPISAPDVILLGWREWCALPELGLPAIKAKIDTGAKSSALHTFHIEPFEHGGRRWVRFSVHPLQNNVRLERVCTAPVMDERWVTDSGGHREMRFIIESPVQIGKRIWPIEISLTNRDPMRFRMLLGRSAMQEGIVVDPSASYLYGKAGARRIYGLLKKDKKR